MLLDGFPKPHQGEFLAPGRGYLPPPRAGGFALGGSVLTPLCSSPPSQVRRPPPTEEPSAAKRLLVLLLAVVSAQVYSATEDVTPEVAATPAVTPEKPAVTPETLTPPVVTSLPGDGAPLRTAVTLAGTTWTPNGTLVGTPVGASCPRLLLSPALWPHNSTTGGVVGR